MRYRIPNVLVERVFEHAELARGYKDEQGITVLEYHPAKWFVHLSGSSESLCLGPEKPDLEAGDFVDILIIPKDPTNA